MNTKTIKLGGAEYVIIPKDEYARMLSGTVEHDAVDAVEYARTTIGRNLRAAREHAGLTQIELAARLGKSQTLVSGAESGRMSAGDRYVAAVLKACGLPPSWAGPKPPRSDSGRVERIGEKRARPRTASGRPRTA